jgi:hypothetical protein
LRVVSGVYSCIGAGDAERELELSSGLFGDLILLGDQNTVFDYDMHRVLSSGLHLRSHGGLEEQVVPFMICAPPPYSLNESYCRRLTTGKIRNYSLWEYLLHGIES